MAVLSGNASAAGRLGRKDRRAFPDDTNLRRCVRPQRAGHFGLRAYVDVTAADWQTCAARRGGPDRSAKKSGGKPGGFTLARIDPIVQRSVSIPHNGMTRILHERSEPDRGRTRS